MAEYFIQLKDNNGNLLYPRTRWAVILDKPTFVTPEQLALKQDLLTSTNAGDGITISNGVISVNAGADFEFVNGQLHLKGLPTATNGQVLTSDGQGGVTWTTPGGTYVLPLAASGTRGGIQIGYYDDYANKRYGVKLSNEKAYIEVPWTDTTYSAGNGLALTGTTFSIKLATNSGLSVDGNGLTIASGTIPTHTSDLVNDGSDGSSTYIEGADLAMVATSGDYNDLLNKPTIPDAMQFKGSLGTGGTITTLPTASAANSGYTYKVITAGTYAGQAAKVGDLFVSNGTEWIRIPSGDEPSGTVTSVGIANGGALTVSGSPITSSGTITIAHADTSSQASVANSGRTYIQSVTLDTYGHVTALTSATETVTNTTYSFRTGTTAGAFDVKASTASSWTSVPIYGLKAFAYKDAIAVSDLPISATTPISFSSAGVITHDTSGVTGTTTGESGATRTLAYGGTFVVPYITYNSYGHITATANKTLTLPAQYVHPTYTEAAAAAKKIGRDATGHVVIGGNITAADVGAITLSSLSGTNPILYDGAGVFSLSYDTNTLGLTTGDMPQLKVKDNGHSHTASNISDFSSSVRGLIGATAPITYSSSTGKVSLTIGAGLTTSSNALIVDTSWLSGEIDTALDGYATEDWVTGQNYITLNSLSADSPITYSAGTFGHATTLTTAKTLGLYKVAVNTFGHITNTAAVVKDDITNLGIPGTDTNTTYSLNVNGTGVNTGKVGLVSANPASTTWYVIPYATTAGSTPLATAANQLNSSVDGNPIGAGSSTNPVYFSNGLPVACGFTVETSVPANAVFTDTNTWRPIKYNTTTLNDASTTLEFIAGSNTSLSFSNGKLTISATNTTYSFSSPLQLDTETNTVSILVGTTGGVAAYGHTHPTSIATTTDNINLNLNYSGQYKLTAGGTDFVFTLPAIYSLPAATSGALGGIKIGYTTDTTNRNYAVQLSSEKAFVNVPWTDTTSIQAKANANGIIQYKASSTATSWTDVTAYTHPAYTAATAAAVKVGRDATGHVVIGAALAAGDISNFTTAARGAISGSSPISYNSSTGAISLTLASNSGLENNNGLKIKLTQGSGLNLDSDGLSVENPLPAHLGGEGSYLTWNGSMVAWGNVDLAFATPSSSETTTDYTLAASTRYKITVGGTSKIIQTTPNTTYTANNGITLSGTTFGHSNSAIDAANLVFKKISYNAYGHIIGTADVTANDLPSHTHAYTQLTGSGTTANQAIVSNGTANGWTLKTLGSAAFTSAYTGTAPIKISSANAISLDFAQDLTNGQNGLTHANTVTSGTAGEGGSTRTLAFGGTFNVPSVTYDGHGHITSKGSVTLTLPANPNVDEKVKLTAKTDNVNYRIILGPASPTSGSTYDAYYSNTTNKVLTFNPSTGNLAATQLNGVTIGSSPKFTDTTYSAGNGLDLSNTTFSVKVLQGSGLTADANGLSIDNPVPGHTTTDGTFLIWNGTSTAWGSLPTGSTSQAGILQLGTGSAQAAQGNHTHAWNSLTRSSTTAGQAIVSTSTANGWELKTLGSAAYTASTAYAAATHDHVWTDITNRPSSLPNTYSLNIKVNTETTNFVSYDGSSAKTLTIAPSTTNGAFTISDGTTTKTIQLNGAFTDTTYSLTTSGNSIILKRGSTNQDTITAPYATSAGSASKLGSATLGSTTKPIYLSSGTATECNTYAGGTAVTLNGTSKAASTASFYAPTSTGTSGQFLKWPASGSTPTWATITTSDIQSFTGNVRAAFSFSAPLTDNGGGTIGLGYGSGLTVSSSNLVVNYAPDLSVGQDGLTHANTITSVSTQGLRKIAYDGHGHITGSTAVTKADIPTLDYLPLTGGTLTPPASTGGSGSSARAPLVIDCSAMSSGAWTEGIRIKPAASGWTSFMLCGTDNTTNINSSANSWSMHTYQGKFGIYRNGSDIATSTMLMGVECSSTGVWTLKTNTSATTSLEIRNTYSSANNHVLADFFATALTNSASTTTSGAFIRVGRDASSYNCADIAFHYTGVNSPTNYLGFGLYGHSYVLNVVGTERVGIKNTAPISELDVTGGISWSSKATSQYNATDDCVEFIFV